MNRERSMIRKPAPVWLAAASAGLLLSFLVAVPAAAVDLGPDAYGYRATNKATYSFLDIRSTGTRLLAGQDDARATINLGFAFRFYGNSYTAACVSTNGLITLGDCVAGDDFAPVDLTSTPPPGNGPSLAALWRDLTFEGAGADGIYYQTLGSAGSRQFVVQWNNAFAPNLADPMTFQAIFNEGANTILLQYQDVGGGAAAVSGGAGSTVGIRAADGHKNGRVLQWSYNAPVLADKTAIRFELGVPRLSGAIGGKGTDATGYYVDLKLSNTGTGKAKGASVTGIAFRTLAGTGSVTLKLPSKVPVAVGDLDIGASTTVRLYLDRPATVTRFSITENGTVQDVAGTSFSLSISQSVIP